LKTVIIIGGGLSGLVHAILLARAGVSCTLIEKKKYPFHRVCGEYISNETVPFLQSLDLYPQEFFPPAINRFQLTSINGQSVTLQLDLGGFGISRYAFDHFLFKRAMREGVAVHQGLEVEQVSFLENRFEVKAGQEILIADVVIGSYGKRSKMDLSLNRNFVRKRSPYIGVKYHIRTKHDDDLISLHNFKNGYCGISNIENGETNLCYLTHRDNLKKSGNIRKMEEDILFRNPFLKSIFTSSEFLFDKPETINEISFETKGPVDHHILMTGDAAGMITPLCGNGMAMAIHSAKLLSKYVLSFCEDPGYSREKLEREYANSWIQNFEKRLWAGRQIQRLFGNERTSNFAVRLVRSSKSLARFLVRNTHGTPF
jgi:flavin-dependent dehydrogenase